MSWLGFELYQVSSSKTRCAYTKMTIPSCSIKCYLPFALHSACSQTIKVMGIFHKCGHKDDVAIEPVYRSHHTVGQLISWLDYVARDEELPQFLMDYDRLLQKNLCMYNRHVVQVGVTLFFFLWLCRVMCPQVMCICCSCTELTSANSILTNCELKMAISKSGGSL